MLYMCTRVAKLGVSLALKPWGNQHLHVSVLEALVAAGQRRQSACNTLTKQNRSTCFSLLMQIWHRNMMSG